MEKLHFLIDYLLKENKEIKVEKMPTNIEDKKNLWRSLCNIRDAKPISNEYLQIEKEYLKLAIENGIKTIAFPCISTGEFRFPKELACKIAIQTVDSFLTENREKIDKVIFNVYGEEDYKIYEHNIRKN